MSWTNLSLGYNWSAGEWPEYVEVDHDDGRGSGPRRYVPERTCGEWRGDPRHEAIGHAAAHEDDELWCEHCDIELDESWLYCPNCGARVVGNDDR